MIDGREKAKIPSKFAKRAAQYNEFGYKTKLKTYLFTNFFDLFFLLLLARIVLNKIIFSIDKEL